MPDKKLSLVVLTGFFLAYFIFASGEGSFASGSGELSDAYSFYNRYGTGRFVFRDGEIYYGSRGSKGAVHGMRYGVSGQEFVITDDKGRQYTCGIALEGSHPGTCKRISYVTVEDYRYSLYKVSYDTLFKRLEAKYEKVDFSSLLYNHRISLGVNFFLCLSPDGVDQGEIYELEDGTIRKEGQVYNTYEGISHAAEWSPQTLEALKRYYDIMLEINQPSTYYIRFHKNGERAIGSMEDQEFYYGESGRIRSSMFENPLTYVLDAGSAWDQKKNCTLASGMVLEAEKESRSLLADFLGWSYSEEGPVAFGDGETVSNLTDQNQHIIDLYAVWDHPQVELSEIESTKLISSMLKDKEKADWNQIRFLGWSRKEIAIQPENKRLTDIRGCFAAGERVIPAQGESFYGVWAYMPCRIIWKHPENGVCNRMRHYTQKDMSELRRMIKGFSFRDKVIWKQYGKGGYLA